MKPEQLLKLKKPFPAEDLEWRLQSCGGSNGKYWGMCLAYITSRAVQDRLDEVCGVDGWQVSIKKEGEAYLATLSIRIEHDDGTVEWISRTDGADSTDIEAVKGGISGAIKRCAVLFGVGRYLYNLKNNWAETSSNDKPSKEYPFMGKTKEGMKFTWRPPKLPDWALPEEERGKSASENSQPALSPEAERERNAEMANNPEYIQLKNELTPFLNAPFIAKDSRDNIREAIDNYKVTYMKKILSWCNSEREKAMKAAS